MGALDAARTLAEELLFPAAMAIERSAVIPAAYLDALADAGLYGLYGPPDAGGFDADQRTAARVVEALGGASLTTAFVWIQHHSTLRALRSARPALRDRWIAPLCRGTVRSGIAFAALRRPGPPAMVAEPDGPGWLLTGVAPWVTGWERIGVVYTGARCGDEVVWALVDAAEDPTLTTAPSELAAVASSSTVALHLDRHPVAPDRVVDLEAHDDWTRRDSRDPSLNGYLAIGVAARAAALSGERSLGAAVDRARDALDHAQGDDLIVARADASLLAVRTTTALVVAGGGRSVELGHHAQRLAREAMFLLVFAQTAPIRSAQLDRLRTGAPVPRT